MNTQTTMPAFFTTHTGDLCRNDSTCAVVREGFAHTHREIATGAELRATLRGGAHAWPGGYALALVTSDCAFLCFACARDNLRLVTQSIRGRNNDGWRVIGTACEAESDERAECDNCGALIWPGNEEEDIDDDPRPVLDLADFYARKRAAFHLAL